MTMRVVEGITYEVADFICPVCKEKHIIVCKPKRDNPKNKTNRHYVK